MSHEEGRIRTVEDAGAEAMELFRKIDVERQENPVARPALTERAMARVIDSIVHVLMVFVILFGYSALFVQTEDEATIFPGAGDGTVVVSSGNMVDDLTGAPSWGPVRVGWKVALTLALCVLAVALSEGGQTWALGSTVGKRWTHIRVHRLDGGAAAPVQVVIRSAVLAVPLVITVGFWFGSILYAWTGVAAVVFVLIRIRRDERQRGLHDRIAGTEVFSTDVRS